jgi:hypothetical protein
MSAETSLKPIELRRSYFDGREIILFSDQTWAFANENLTFQSGETIQSSSGFALEDDDIHASVPTDMWTPTDNLVDESVSNHSYRTQDGLVLSINKQFQGGHDGDIGLYTGQKRRPLFEALVLKVSQKVMPGILPEEHEMVLGNVVLRETYFADSLTYYLHLMGQKEALNCDVFVPNTILDDTTKGGAPDRKRFNDCVSLLRENVLIQGKTLTELYPETPVSNRSKESLK